MSCLRCRERRWRQSLRTMKAAILLMREAEAIAILRNLPPWKIAQGQVGDRDYDVFCARSSSALFSRQFF